MEQCQSEYQLKSPLKKNSFVPSFDSKLKSKICQVHGKKKSFFLLAKWHQIDDLKNWTNCDIKKTRSLC